MDGKVDDDVHVDTDVDFNIMDEADCDKDVAADDNTIYCDLDDYFANGDVVEGVFHENIDDGVDNEIEDEDHDIVNDDLDDDTDA